MNTIENKSIQSQIDFEKYKNGEANKVIELLDKSNKEISKYIKQTPDIATKKRYTEVARKVRDVSKSLRKKVEDGTEIDGIIDYELNKQKSILNSIKPQLQKSNGGSFNFLYPTREQIKTAALFKPVDTKSSLTYQSYLEGLENGLYNTWDSAIRTGYLTGMPTNEIVDFVVGKASKIAQLQTPGAMNAFRNSVYANTRTVLQSFANETRNRIYEENEHFFGKPDDYKYEYLATLDSRTCIVCGNLDGKLFKTLKDCPNIPQHRGCRCIVIPYFDIEGDTRAAETGQRERITFNDWIKEQKESVQKEVLGVTRFNKLQQGVEKNIGGFIDNGEVISLNELELKERKQFVESISKECKWFADLPETTVDRFKADLLKVDSYHLNSIYTYTKGVKADFMYDGISTFKKEENKIYMNIEKANIPSIKMGFKTNLNTFLHESGHAIDYNLQNSKKYTSIKIKGFLSAIENDVLNYCNTIARTSYSSIDEFIKNPTAVSLCNSDISLNQDLKNGVQDIINVVTKNTVKGLYSHPYNSYWNKAGGAGRDVLIQIESFAHFCTAKGCGGLKLKFIEEVFKTSYYMAMRLL